jgi:hypothetical protein
MIKMTGWLQLLWTFFETYLWPLGYTAIGIFLGVYLNNLIEAERSLSASILRPLLSESQNVARQSPTQPLASLLSEEGVLESTTSEFEPIELLQLDPELLEIVISYMNAIEQLKRLHRPHIPVAEILAQVGYTEYLLERLPSEIVVEGDRGIDPTPRPDFPGPGLFVGDYTMQGGESAYFSQGYVAPVTAVRRYPILAFLLENFSQLQAAEGVGDLREVCRRSSEIDVELLDQRAPEWDSDLWGALTTQFEPRDTVTSQLDISTDEVDEPSQIVTSGSFFEVVRNCEMAVRLMQQNARSEVIDRAADLSTMTAHRLSMRVYDPRRLRLANRTSMSEEVPSLGAR